MSERRPSPLRAEDEARRQAVADGRGEQPHRVRCYVVAERWRFVESKLRVLRLVKPNTEFELVDLLDLDRESVRRLALWLVGHGRAPSAR